MKFLRKVLALCLAMVFLIALIIGAGIILSVQNVNVRFVYYGDNAYTADYAKTRTNLDKLKGSGLLFITDEDINSKLENTDALAVESYQKVYPCTIDIVIRQRVETFAVRTGDMSYDVYDEMGTLMRSSTVIDGVDGSPNVVVSGFAVEELPTVAKTCQYFKDTFSSFRRLVKSVSEVKVANSAAFQFTLRSGFVIRVHGCDGGEGDLLKITKAYEKYSTLTDFQKLDGVMDVVVGANSGEPIVIYPGYVGF